MSTCKGSYEKQSKGILFHQGNAPAYKSVVTMSTVHVCGFELIDHPPYSLDLAQDNYFCSLT